MLIKHDKEVDAKYITIRKGEVARTQEVQSWLLIDRDEKERLLGVEVLDASRHPLSLVVDTDGRAYVVDTIPKRRSAHSAMRPVVRTKQPVVVAR